MIIVPAFAQREQREPEIVPAVVLRRETLRADDMRERVDEKRRVQQHNRADEKAPDKHLRSIGAKTWRMTLKQPAAEPKRSAIEQRHDLIEAIQKHEFGKFLQVAHAAVVGGKILG